MPVSKTSIFGDRSVNLGGSRWIDQRSTSIGASFSSTGSPMTFQTRPESRLTDGNGDRLTGVLDREPAREAVRGVHGHGPDAIVAEVLLHLRDQRPRLFTVLAGNLDPNGVVDLGQALGKDGVDHDTLDLHDAAGLLSGLVWHESPVTRAIAARIVRRRHKFIGVLL